MATFKQILLKLLIKIFNVVYGILQIFGIELIPVTLDEIVRELTDAQKEIFLKQDFTEPVKIIVEACNTTGNSISGLQRFILIKSIRYEFDNSKCLYICTVQNFS